MHKTAHELGITTLGRRRGISVIELEHADLSSHELKMNMVRLLTRYMLTGSSRFVVALSIREADL